MPKHPLIYSVGDSHCWHVWLKVPYVRVQTSGPMTMYRFGQDKPFVLTGIPEEAIVCFSWGEIDCRCHVNKFQPWQETIDELVKNYFDAIEANIKKPENAWIFNVVPPPRREAAIESPGFPFLGTDEERLAYVRYMNKKLSECGSRGYTFIDVYEHYCDQDGFMIPEKSDGHVHIADEKPVIQWLERKLNEMSNV